MDVAPNDPVASGTAGFLADLGTLDQIGLGLAALFLLLGAIRGLWWQVIRFAGLVGAGILARWLAPRWSPSLSESSGLPPVVAQGLVWFAVFVLGLLAASLLGLIGKKSLDAMQLGPVDRFGGALAGAVTGLFMHAAFLLGLSYLGPQPWTADNLRGTRSQTLLRLVSTRLPVLLDRESVAAREISSWLGTSAGEMDQLALPSDASSAPHDGSEQAAPGEDVPQRELHPDERSVPVEASAPRHER